MRKGKKEIKKDILTHMHICTHIHTHTRNTRMGHEATF